MWPSGNPSLVEPIQNPRQIHFASRILLLAWSDKQIAGDNLESDKQVVRAKDWLANIKGLGVKWCPCCDGTVSEALVQRASQAASRQAPGADCEGRAGVCVMQRQCMYSTCTKTTNVFFFCESCVCSCARTAKRAQGGGLH